MARHEGLELASEDKTARKDIVRLDYRKIQFLLLRTVRSLAMRGLATLLVTTLVAAVPVRAKAEPMREFILSCSYGVIAGTLVGAASLAFSDKPGDNLNRVARGASIGLYAGILLGLYVVYGVPSEDDDAVAMLGSFQNGSSVAGARRSEITVAAPKAFEPPRMALLPVIGDRGVEGGAVQVRVLNF